MTEPVAGGCRDEPGAALAGSDVVRVPEQLDVERRVGRVGDRVDVQRLV